MYRWIFHTAEELGSSPQHGRLAIYHGGGYVHDLVGGYSSALDIVGELRENGWLDRGTRVVFIDFSLYNANVNLFCIVRYSALRLCSNSYESVFLFLLFCIYIYLLSSQKVSIGLNLILWMLHNNNNNNNTHIYIVPEVLDFHYALLLQSYT